MLLLAYLDRTPIPPALLPDLKYVLQKSPILLEEMVKISNLPRSAFLCLNTPVTLLSLIEAV